MRDPEFYQFDRGDQKRGGREKNEKYGMGKGEIGERGEKGGSGVEKAAAGQMTRPAGSPFYSDILLEEEMQQEGIRGRRKFPSQHLNPPSNSLNSPSTSFLNPPSNSLNPPSSISLNPPSNSISFPEKPFKEPESPEQLTGKAEGGFWNSNLDDVDSAWKPSFTYVTPTKKDYDNDNTEALENERKMGEDLRQSMKEGAWVDNTNNFGFNDVVNKNKLSDEAEHLKKSNGKGYTEKEGEDFNDTLNTLLTGERFMNLRKNVH